MNYNHTSPLLSFIFKSSAFTRNISISLDYFLDVIRVLNSIYKRGICIQNVYIKVSLKLFCLPSLTAVKERVRMKWCDRGMQTY